MKFTTPCFNIYIQVRVEDVKKRKELIGWLFNIGYELCEDLIGIDGDTPVVIAAFGKIDLWVRTHCKSETCFDCGENIELFKALAAMNDENDREQWYVCKKGKNEDAFFLKCTITNITEWYYLRWYYICRKATVEEIIGHFKKSEK